MLSLMASAVSTQPAGGINAITFTLHGTRNMVMIKGGLTEESTMREIMENGAAFYDSIDTYKYEVGLANLIMGCRTLFQILHLRMKNLVLSWIFVGLSYLWK
jgi:hypothetical protein